ncbi:site-specific DNA-methyltransferase [Lactobacillus sp. ESL0731]|uniref:DNA-methyltransferase n=1 Tax=unclassified Lactobacillus TaxID=2620435 RepID=UPI0023F89A04|nr:MULTISPECIES: site-specific DNA-methyltransferase [unclassified Lactobacillus]WEV51604.1 site-specific DNA-methyltransferase [Lactobacillus sp. ESL0700]WEV62733.1 site-specific DNA-methyltransferase [Lactobacillus sp. ESL0731]
MKEFYSDKLVTLFKEDAFNYLKSLANESIDLIVTDPPYFLSNGGFSNSGGKMVSVNKGKWDELDPDSAEQFYLELLKECKRVLKIDGTLWLFGTLHNIYLLGYLLNKNDFKILNNITWQKSNPAPNLSRRMFTHSTETILWARKKDGKQYFNYDLMRAENNHKQMKDVWTTSTISRSEKRFGKHPTQKPLALLKRILEASSKPDYLILDPFIGSGTTAVAGKLLNRKVIGIDSSEEYLDIAVKRLRDYKNEKVGKIK